MRQCRSRVVRWSAMLAVSTAVVCGSASAVSAHDGIAWADPEPGSTIAEPISEVTLGFPAEVTDDVRISLLDPDENPIDSSMTVVSPTVARISFAPLDRMGRYIVRYDATVIADGHLLTGAMSFDYGSTGNGMSAIAWLVIVLGSAAILAGGIAISVRNQRQLQDSEDAPTLKR